jgi:hypothetical protein
MPLSIFYKTSKYARVVRGRGFQYLELNKKIAGARPAKTCTCPVMESVQ